MSCERISQTAVMSLRGRAMDVFPLFGAIEESKWAEGWEPEILYSSSGGVEEQMVFRTKPMFPDEQGYLWIVTRYDPRHMQVVYTVFTEQRMWTISVGCKEQGDGETEATVTYTYTGLSDIGNRRNAEALKLMYANNLKDWEDAINRYLREAGRG